MALIFHQNACVKLQTFLTAKPRASGSVATIKSKFKSLPSCTP